MAGTVYEVAPIPPDAAHTTYVDAGALKFGVEFRLLDDAELAANYAGRDMEEIQAAIQTKGNADIEDDGVSIHVVGADDDHEYLRFDMFERQPHYHYIDRSGRKNTIVEFDEVALGDMPAWVLDRLRTRLPEMLAHAGGADLTAKLDAGRIEAALREVERLVDRARAVPGPAHERGA
jgi:hypothetical protein